MKKTVLITCGALSHEVVFLMEKYEWKNFIIQCLPADYHNTPNKIPEAVREKIHEAKKANHDALVLYGDCGTGGLLDKVCDEEGIDRIPGPHCYAFYTELKKFEEFVEKEPAVFFLTDYLVRFFDSLIWKGLGLDRYPQLLEDYFQHYEKLVYLAQTENAEWREKAAMAAERLGLKYEYRYTGYGELEEYLVSTVREQREIPVQSL